MARIVHGRRGGSFGKKVAGQVKHTAPGESGRTIGASWVALPPRSS
jgi:hypothetical protein